MRRDAPNPWPPFVLAFLVGLATGGALGHWLPSRTAPLARHEQVPPPRLGLDEHGEAMARRLASELQQAISRRRRR